MIIPTLNRAEILGDTLRALRRFRYRDFEIVAVDGPFMDNTSDVLSQYSDIVRAGTCPERNHAAILNDDGIPDENWLQDLSAGFDADAVAGVAGTVYARNGSTVPYKNCRANRYGDSAPRAPHFLESSPLVRVLVRARGEFSLPPRCSTPRGRIRR